ncbi:MAG: hypothetical protein M3Y54_03320 [Bacteroidota bacterium]|nr:hypothetical protein [Bacteroidota bacterium]
MADFSSSQNQGASIPDLAGAHLRLQSRLTWLLPLGVALLGWLAWALYDYAYRPRTTLDGYSLRQVGVRADSSWWILAYRIDNGQAEVLSTRDTLAGWQHHPLGVDSAQARALALDWGRQALLLGDTTVRILNDSLQQVGPVLYPFERGQGIRGRWLAADPAGGRAVVASGNGAVYATTRGGTSWEHVPLKAGGDFALQGVTYAGTEPGADPLAVRFGLISRRGYVYLTVYDITLDHSLAIAQTYTRWGSKYPLPFPVAWCGHGPGDPLIAYDQKGNWVTARDSGQDAEAGRFFGSVRSAARLGHSGQFMGVSATRLYSDTFMLPNGSSNGPAPSSTLADSTQPIRRSRSAGSGKAGLRRVSTRGQPDNPSRPLPGATQLQPQTVAPAGPSSAQRQQRRIDSLNQTGQNRSDQKVQDAQMHPKPSAGQPNQQVQQQQH